MVIVCVYETVLNCLHAVTPTPQALQSLNIQSVNITAVISVLKPLKRRERERETANGSVCLFYPAGPLLL